MKPTSPNYIWKHKKFPKTSEELHDYLLELKHKNSDDPDIAEYKEVIRKHLRNYRYNQPYPPTNYARPESDLEKKDVVFYSFEVVLEFSTETQ